MSITLILGPMFSGKCLGPNTRVRMYPSGTKLMENIMPGDIVMNGMGLGSTVVYCEMGSNILYRIWQKHGITYDATQNHLLSLFDPLRMDAVTISVSDYVAENNARLLFGYKKMPRENVFSKLTVTKVGAGVYCGFELDPESDGLFQLEDGTVTHNTSTMGNEVERCNIAQLKCIIIKYSGDMRYSIETGLRTHNGKCFCGDIATVSTTHLRDVNVSDFEVIGIDEIQFFDDSVETLTEWANAGKTIICSGLSTDFQMHPFKRVAELQAKCEHTHHKLAVCMRCYKDAAFNGMKSAARDTLAEGISIGGKDKYMALCRTCYNYCKSNGVIV
jgi:thymidine kinase